MKVYKLTTQKNQTYNGFQWEPDVWKETSGSGNLCGPGWLHAYSDPLVAAFMNPTHADISNPILPISLSIGQTRSVRVGALLAWLSPDPVASS